MKALRVHAHSRPARFTYEDAPQPKPGDGEVLIRVHAAAVTPTELEWAPTWSTVAGTPRPLPVILGHEFSGTVSAVGPHADGFAEGDAVFGMNDWFRDGAQAEFCVAKAQEVARKPASVDHVHAAVTPISALTAWQGLLERGQLTAGQRVLIHGASGGVGSFAVQLARLQRAHVIGTASAANLDFVRELGADEVIDYRAERFESLARDVDLVFDTVGGETLDRSWSVLRPGGKLVTVAASSESARSPRERDAFFIVEAKRDQLAEVARRIDAGELRPVVGAVFALSDGSRAYERKPPRGKTVLRVAEEGSRSS